MTILFTIIAIIISIILLIGLIGLLLPKERVVSRQSYFDASPEIVYKVVTNNEDYAYRTDVHEIRILEIDVDFEVWEEVAYNGTVIKFRTKEKTPHSFYSFDLESELFSGFWTAEFHETENGGTHFIATEHIRIKNPYLKVFSYLFFNIGRFMETYQNDLKAKLKQYSKKPIKASLSQPTN